MSCLSLFSGIEAASVAWQPVAFAEIESFPCAVLTPRGCERLMGFPDGYACIERRGKPAADTPRYNTLGNSMAVPVTRCIGEKIGAAMSLGQAELWLTCEGAETKERRRA